MATDQELEGIPGPRSDDLSIMRGEAEKPWRMAWSMAGVWVVECNRQGDGYGRNAGHLTFSPDDKAIAQMITAAPALLKALREAVEYLEQTLNWRGEGWECSEDELLGEARAAIAKATGQ